MFLERYPNVCRQVEKNFQLLDVETVSLDIDGVTQATYVLALNKFSHRIGRFVSKNELISYWELDRIAVENGIAESEAGALTKGAWNRNDVYNESPKMPGMESLLKILNTVGIPYVFISSRPPEFTAVTQAWFAKTFPWVKPENIILGRAEGVHGGNFKASQINKLGIGLHLEDALEEAEIITKETKARVLVVPQPWNISQPVSHNHFRHLGQYKDNNGSWQVVRYLASKNVQPF